MFEYGITERRENKRCVWLLKKNGFNRVEPGTYASDRIAFCFEGGQIDVVNNEGYLLVSLPVNYYAVLGFIFKWTKDGYDIYL